MYSSRAFFASERSLSFRSSAIILLWKRERQRDECACLDDRWTHFLISETIQFGLNESTKLGFTIERETNGDPGLFVVGIKAKGLAAKNGRLRVTDRLLQITNRSTTVNLQCLELDTALRLIRRMKKESTTIKLLVAHRNAS